MKEVAIGFRVNSHTRCFFAFFFFLIYIEIDPSAHYGVMDIFPKGQPAGQPAVINFIIIPLRN